MLITFNKCGGRRIAVDPAQVASVNEGEFKGHDCVWMRFINPETRNEALDESLDDVVIRLNNPVGLVISTTSENNSLDDEIPF